VPHHEQTASSLPIKRLQRGQRIARRVIRIPRKFQLLCLKCLVPQGHKPWVPILHYRYRILTEK